MMADKGKVGRNDPCPCGSGKKYKRCCMARDKAAQADRVAWERAAQDMRIALIGFAKERTFVRDLAMGLGLFWQDRYTTDTAHLMSVDESLRFFDWFVHDYTLQGEDAIESGVVAPVDVGHRLSAAGRRLIEVYRDDAGDTLSIKEASILKEWIESLPGSAFILEEVDAEQGIITIRDLFLSERTVTAHDAAAARHGQVGQILLARPLSEHDRVRLSGATVVLPASEQDGLQAFVGEGRLAYLDEHPEATEAQFLRERAYLLTHYALEWAEREGRPVISAQDPDVRRPGGRALQKLVKWSQERVQVR
jgi:hypothetical protein